MTSDIKDSVTITEQVETTSEKPDEEYVGNKYIIKQKVQDKSDYHEVDQPVLWSLSSTVCSLVIFSLDRILLIKLSKGLKRLKTEKSQNKKT